MGEVKEGIVSVNDEVGYVRDPHTGELLCGPDGTPALLTLAECHRRRFARDYNTPDAAEIQPLPEGAGPAPAPAKKRGGKQ